MIITTYWPYFRFRYEISPNVTPDDIFQERSNDIELRKLCKHMISNGKVNTDKANRLCALNYRYNELDLSSECTIDIKSPMVDTEKPVYDIFTSTNIDTEIGTLPSSASNIFLINGLDYNKYEYISQCIDNAVRLAVHPHDNRIHEGYYYTVNNIAKRSILGNLIRSNYSLANQCNKRQLLKTIMLPGTEINSYHGIGGLEYGTGNENSSPDQYEYWKDSNMFIGTSQCNDEGKYIDMTINMLINSDDKNIKPSVTADMYPHGSEILHGEHKNNYGIKEYTTKAIDNINTKVKSKIDMKSQDMNVLTNKLDKLTINGNWLNKSLINIFNPTYTKSDAITKLSEFKRGASCRIIRPVSNHRTDEILHIELLYLITLTDISYNDFNSLISSV